MIAHLLGVFVKQPDSGPIPRLVKLLALAASKPGASSWSQAVESAGGLWEASVIGRGDDFWPAELRQAGYRWTEWAGIFRAMVANLRQIGDSTRRWDGAQWFETLTDCHAWLARGNLHALAPKFLPFWRDLPWPLLDISYQGVVWALGVYTFQTLGPQTIERMAPLLQTTGGRPTAGDLISLHLLLENLVCGLAERFRLKLPTVFGQRRMGGLRSERFIGSYLALGQAPEGSPAANCFRQMHRLIALSQLTQLVYLDVIRRSLLDAQPDRDLLPRLNGLTESAQQEGVQQKTALWRELWLSHLARSLLAACFGPPPSFEIWQTAEQQSEQIEAEVRAKLMRKRRHQVTTVMSAAAASISQEVSQHPLVQAARAKCDTLKEAMRQESLERWETVAAWFSGCEYFKLRFLDMMARQVASDEAPRMKERWPGLIRENVEPLPPIPRLIFFLEGNDGFCFQAFETLLLGAQEETKRRKSPPDNEHGRCRDAWTGLLPAGLNEAEISRQAGVTEWAARRLVSRYDRGYVALPFPDERGDAPAQIFAEWFQTMFNRLPATETTNVEATVLE